MDIVNRNFDTITDCFGVEYRVVAMPGTGFCLYHGLSYCLTGNNNQYADIIDDCLTVFHNIPHLFRLRTNFGSYFHSSLSLDQYRSYMQDTIQLVQSGLSVDSHAYGDDGHIAAIALLYDVSVFTYSTQTRSWYVFNESARQGYICLLHTPDHFNVLQGLDGGPPTIPSGAHTHGVNRHDFETSVDAWNSLQRNYSFQNVFRFSELYSGVRIINRPLVAHENTNLSNAAVNKCASSAFMCDYEQCSYVAKSANDLEMHTFSLHSVKKCKCDFEDCGYIAKNANSLSVHKVRWHSAQTSKLTQTHKKTRKLLTAITGDKGESVMSTGGQTSSVCAEAVNTSGIDDIAYDCDFVSMDRNIVRLEGTSDNCSIVDTVPGDNCMEGSNSKCKEDRAYMCDFEQCGFVGKNAISLRMHKVKSHTAHMSKTTERQKMTTQLPITVTVDSDVEGVASTCGQTNSICTEAGNTNGTDDIANDTASVVSVDSNISRRSARIATKRTAFYIDSVSGCKENTAYMCDYEQCSFVGKNGRSLSMHKFKSHSALMLKTTETHKNTRELLISVAGDIDVENVTSTCGQTSTEAGNTNGTDDIANDAASVVSVDSNISRRSACIATKRTAFYIDSLSGCKENTAYMCDYEHCSFVGKSSRSLSMHKSKSHSVPMSKTTETHKKTRQLRITVASDIDVENVTSTCGQTSTGAGNTNGTDDMTNDTASVVSIDSNVCRRSARLTYKRTASYVDNLSGCPSSRKAQCGSVKHNNKFVHETTTGLADKSGQHKPVRPSVSLTIESDNASVSSVVSMDSGLCRSARISNRNRKSEGCKVQSDKRQETVTNEVKISNRNVKKSHVKKSFARIISEFDKEFRPKKGLQQNDPLYDSLKAYHDNLLRSVSNTTTEKISAEVVDVIENVSLVDSCDRRYQWSVSDEERLNELNRTCKQLQPRVQWTWGAADDSERGRYNDKRMQLCVTKECEWKIIECNQCESTGILVGDQLQSEICYDCMKLYRVSEKEREKKVNAWNEVKPVSKDFPKAADGKDLPKLTPGEIAVITPVHVAITITKNHYADKRLRIESISLLQDPVPTWVKVLPRTNLASRFMVIERRVKQNTKYIVANADRVREWLRYLFVHHKDFIRMRLQHELSIDEGAINALQADTELAEVDSGLTKDMQPEGRQIDETVEPEDDGITDATAESGLSETHVFTFDRYNELYLKTKDILKIRKEGQIEIIKDDTVRKQTYSSSASLSFPHLHPHGEKDVLEDNDYKLGRYLLRKQALYPHRMSDGRLEWTYANDDIYLAHQFSRLSEQTVRANVQYYLTAHPSVQHVPLSSIITAFRDGVDQDSGLLNSHVPDLTTVMSQLPNSRQFWLQERLAISQMSCDSGSPNLFVTINLDPRASPDVRRLIYRLEYGRDMDHDEPFVRDTNEFTRLMNKHSVFVNIYLYRKVKIIMEVFFTDICGIPKKEVSDWTQQDVTESGYYFGRVEFTETRGYPHWHFIAKLPHVLDTGLLGRIIHNGRLVRNELKCGNVRQDKYEQAWTMIRMGLLASRYVALFAHSISTASFYSEEVGIDGHDDDKVIRLEDYRKQFTNNYKNGIINLETHPIMRRFDDRECNENLYHEMAQVASVSCLHNCIRGACGGDPVSGDGCRFDFPKKPLKHTVAAVMQINAQQMECRILLRRTSDRVANLNRYFLRYLRSNHDVSVLIDSAHKLRYATKYCAKSGKHQHLLDEMLEHLSKRCTDLVPPNLRQTLTSLLLADCSHRTFISKSELAYRVAQLPDIMKSYPNVGVVGFYTRHNLYVPYNDEFTLELSDRTEYTAYSERTKSDSELGRGLTINVLANMCFRDFAETVNHKWINTTPAEPQVIDEKTRRKFRTRDVNSGHWRLTLSTKRKHIRPSTVLNTAPAIDYELIEHGRTTTQTTFYDLEFDKRHQLYRAYYELVMYVPWEKTPDETFLSEAVRAVLDNKDEHAEIDSRHSLQRLEEFFKVYKEMHEHKMVAIPGTAWHRDNQFAYSMYLVNQHNRDVHLDRVDNKGVLKAQYEEVDELTNVDIDIRPAVNDASDLSDYPTFESFMPPQDFREIVEQKPLELTDISVAFPLHNNWQQVEELATHDRTKRFIASPPPSPVDYSDMTQVQQFAVDLGIDKQQQILFICGRAGSGKTAVALTICEHFRGKVQATAYTGKAASLFNGPTIHSMFSWSHNEHRSVSTVMKPDSKKVQDFRIVHEDIELFVIEEALAIPPACFALMDEMMTAAFNPKHETDLNGDLPPFGGKKLLFLGDHAQMPPIGGPAVYADGSDSTDSSSVRRESKLSKRTKTGQLIFQKYLVTNCIYLHQGQRNTGLLGEICDRMRQGTLTEDDCVKLTYQRARFPDVVTDYGIYYQNEMCSMYNWRQLWNECKSVTPPCRMYLCKATYHVTENNDQIVEALSALPPQAYDYAPDILAIAEGCEVRLIHNVNTSAGLVTSSSGTVVRVIYNNADLKLLLSGEHVVPYCVIVSFESFQGFIVRRSGSTRRIYPFANQPTWVPMFRRRFSVKVSSLPTWLRKSQLEKDCYRIQFPIDLASNITAHRAQGQTMANCLVSVDLGLDNPDMRLPPDLASLLYVACTRVTKLANLFVSAIHPCALRKIGQSDADKLKRVVDDKLKTAAIEFATSHGKKEMMEQEVKWQTDYSANSVEWQGLQKQSESPKPNGRLERFSLLPKAVTDFHVDTGDVQFSMVCKPVMSERHVGIDQGVRNFAIAVIERIHENDPVVVHAMNHTDLQLKERFSAADVLCALKQRTDLLLWMNPGYGDNTVDRVIVHLEQIDARNRHAKQFSVELGKLLQQQAVDHESCVVKMSQPHIHRFNGPLFRLGDEIQHALQLQKAFCQQKRSKADANPSALPADVHENETELSDVEPSDEPAVDREHQSESREYRVKKKISSEFFRYIIEADEERMQQMKLTVHDTVQSYWREKIASDSNVKLDDVGDAVLHALNELLCGSSNFKQLVPAAPTVHVNRTVAIAVFPVMTYWIVLNCRWNAFVLENFGSFESGLYNCYYKASSTVDKIKANVSESLETWSALLQFEGSVTTHDPVDHIKVVVKQTTGHSELALTNEQAGALTDATSKAMKQICDSIMGVNSKLYERHDRILGSKYIRTSTVHHDRKFQVVNSTGKHTNAVLSCLSWMQQNFKDFVDNRREFLCDVEKRRFYDAMRNIAQSEESRIEMLQMSDFAKRKFLSGNIAIITESDRNFERNIADLVLIGMSKNQNHVKAVAANSRKPTEKCKQSNVSEKKGDQA